MLKVTIRNIFYENLPNLTPPLTGNDVLEAFVSFKRNQDYLLSHGFKEIIAVQYVGDMIRHLEL